MHHNTSISNIILKSFLKNSPLFISPLSMTKKSFSLHHNIYSHSFSNLFKSFHSHLTVEMCNCQHTHFLSQIVVINSVSFQTQEMQPYFADLSGNFSFIHCWWHSHINNSRDSFGICISLVLNSDSSVQIDECSFSEIIGAFSPAAYISQGVISMSRNCFYYLLAQYSYQSFYISPFKEGYANVSLNYFVMCGHRPHSGTSTVLSIESISPISFQNNNITESIVKEYNIAGKFSSKTYFNYKYNTNINLTGRGIINFNIQNDVHYYIGNSVFYHLSGYQNRAEFFSSVSHSVSFQHFILLECQGFYLKHNLCNSYYNENLLQVTWINCVFDIDFNKITQNYNISKIIKIIIQNTKDNNNNCTDTKKDNLTSKKNMKKKKINIQINNVMSNCTLADREYKPSLFSPSFYPECFTIPLPTPTQSIQPTPTTSCSPSKLPSPTLPKLNTIIFPEKSENNQFLSTNLTGVYVYSKSEIIQITGLIILTIISIVLYFLSFRKKNSNNVDESFILIDNKQTIT